MNCIWIIFAVGFATFVFEALFVSALGWQLPRSNLCVYAEENRMVRSLRFCGCIAGRPRGFSKATVSCHASIWSGWPAGLQIVAS